VTWIKTYRWVEGLQLEGNQKGKETWDGRDKKKYVASLWSCINSIVGLFVKLRFYIQIMVCDYSLGEQKSQNTEWSSIEQYYFLSCSTVETLLLEFLPLQYGPLVCSTYSLLCLLLIPFHSSSSIHYCST
jgi:hypothetical protein